MDAAMVRAFVSSLEDRAVDARTIPRVRQCLESLGHPDIRYLVGTLRGPGARAVARYARGVLEAAGAPTAELDDPLDDPLVERAGTLVAAAAYHLASLRPELGELSRADASALVALAAAAEGGRRVMLLVDEDADPRAPLLAVAGDAFVLVGLDAAAVRAAIADLPDGRPLVVTAPNEAASSAAVEASAARGLPLVLARRDFAVDAVAGAGAMDVRVGDDRYAGLACGTGDDPLLAATGIVAALALGALGVRMRPDWIEAGARSAAARQ